MRCHFYECNTLCRLTILLSLGQFFLQAAVMPNDQYSPRSSALTFASNDFPVSECNLIEASPKNIFTHPIRMWNSEFGITDPGLAGTVFHQRQFHDGFRAASSHPAPHLRI
mgnify:CR=1 FL=1